MITSEIQDDSEIPTSKIYVFQIFSACAYFSPAQITNKLNVQPFAPALISFGKLLQPQLAASSEPNPTPAAGQSSPCTVGHTQGSNHYSKYSARKTAFIFSSGPQVLHSGIQDALLPLRCSHEEFLSAERVVAQHRHPMKRGRVRCTALAALQ